MAHAVDYGRPPPLEYEQGKTTLMAMARHLMINILRKDPPVLSGGVRQMISDVLHALGISDEGRGSLAFARFDYDLSPSSSPLTLANGSHGDRRRAIEPLCLELLHISISIVIHLTISYCNQRHSGSAAIRSLDVLDGLSSRRTESHIN